MNFFVRTYICKPYVPSGLFNALPKTKSSAQRSEGLIENREEYYGRDVYPIICAIHICSSRETKLNRKELEKKILPIYHLVSCAEKDRKLLAINGMANHVHIFIGLKPDIAISDLVRDIKANSTNFINDNNFVQGKFGWQEGDGAFTYAHAQLDSVIKYIRNQEQNHKRKTFREEYLEMLKKFDVSY